MAESEPAAEIEERGEDHGHVDEDRWGPFGEDGSGECRHGG